jgi:uncharacterized delta-60 repeat protein
MRSPRPAPFRRSPIAVSMLALAALLAEGAGAAPGELDTSFGANGIVVFDTGDSDADRINALLPLPDGSLFAAGSLSLVGDDGSDFAVLKLTPAGNLDPFFEIAGLRTDGVTDSAHALALDANGGVLVAGRLRNGAYTDWALARFHGNGILDTGFGDSNGMGGRLGYVRVNVAPDIAINDQAIDLALQSDGRIVVAGHGYVEEGGFHHVRFALLRFTPDGTLDPTFGDNGRVIAGRFVAETSESASAIAKRANGRLPADDAITLVGSISDGHGAVIRRFLANGAPDPGFNGSGALRIADNMVDGQRVGIASIAGGVLLEDGRLVVTGTANERGFVFLRLHDNGALDTAFGSNGRQLVKFSDELDYDAPNALTLHPDGRVAAAGFSSRAGDGGAVEDFAVAQLLPNGQPDPDFGDGAGRAVYPVSLRRNQALAIAKTPQGGLLIGGFATNENTQFDLDAIILRTLGIERIFRDGFEP